MLVLIPLDAVFWCVTTKQPTLADVMCDIDSGAENGIRQIDQRAHGVHTDDLGHASRVI